MIGILLALQVNNWNELRKERKFEVQALVDLRNEYESNQASFLALSDKLNQRLDSLETYIINLADKDLPINQKTNRRPPLEFAKWKPENDVLNGLFSTGKIENIRNDSLKYYLNRWNETVEQNLGALNSYSKRVEKVQEYERSRIPRHLIVELGVTSDYLFHSEDEMRKFREGIIGDIEYQNTIVSCVNMLKISRSQFNLVGDMNATILSLLERELVVKGIKPE